MVRVANRTDEPDCVDFILNVQDDNSALEYAKNLGLLPKPVPCVSLVRLFQSTVVSRMVLYLP